MTDGSIDCLQVIAGDFMRASELRFFQSGVPCRGGPPITRGQIHGDRASAEGRAGIPAGRRTDSDLLPGQVHGQTIFLVVEAAERIRRDQDLPSAEPGSGVRDRKPNLPSLVIKEKVPDLADLAVWCREFAAVEFLGVE